MTNLLVKIRNGFWDMISSPGTEYVSEVDEDYDDEEYHEPAGYKKNTAAYDEDYDDYEDEPVVRQKQTRQDQNRKVLQMHQKGTGKPHIEARNPEALHDAHDLCDTIRAGRVCIINLTKAEPAVAQRILDILGGACYAVNGYLKKISDHVFVCVPENASYSDDTRGDARKDPYYSKSGRR